MTCGAEDERGRLGALARLRRSQDVAGESASSATELTPPKLKPHGSGKEVSSYPIATEARVQLVRQRPVGLRVEEVAYAVVARQTHWRSRDLLSHHKSMSSNLVSLVSSISATE